MDVSVHRALENHIYGNQSNTVMDICVCVCALVRVRGMSLNQVFTDSVSDIRYVNKY